MQPRSRGWPGREQFSQRHFEAGSERGDGVDSDVDVTAFDAHDVCSVQVSLLGQ
jgi:hypothetical protein